MLKAIYSCVSILIIAMLTFAQVNNSVPEYGTVSELKDLHRVYVYSDDLESRELILEELAKDSQLKVVGKPEDGEFFIYYGRSFFDTGYSSFGGIFGSVTSKTSAEVGEYYVLMRGDKLESGAYRPRILWGKQNLRVVRSNPFIKTNLPAKQVTDKFVKELKQTRGNGK